MHGNFNDAFLLLSDALPPPHLQACVQNSPVHGDWSASVARVDALIEKAKLSAANELDVVLLPEMALTGYTFRDRDHIRRENNVLSDMN